jgi:galactosyltransferase
MTMPTENKRPLIAVVTCRRFRPRADAQRATWVPFVQGADVRFFVGGGSKERSDEVVLDVGDGYCSLPYKSRAVFQWALERGYDHVCKMDDDVYVVPGRLLQGDFRRDYVGCLNYPDDGSAPYASGFVYWLSRRSMEVLVKADIKDWAEDRWVGYTLNDAGIFCSLDRRYVIINSLNPENPTTGTEAPLATNAIVAAAELEPAMMQRVHREWNESLRSNRLETEVA